MKHFLMALSLAAVTTLYADYTMVLQSGEDHSQTLQYKDDKHATMSMGEGSKMMLIGEKAYILTTKDGETTVMDMDEMRAMMGGLSFNVQESARQKKEEMDLKVIKKGKKRTIAGIKGQVWTIEYKEDGEVQRSDVVVTKDKRVVKAMNAFAKVISRMAMNENDDEFLDWMQIKPGYVIIATMEEEDNFELKEFHEKKIPSSAFELPKNAKKQQMPNFGEMFRNDQQAAERPSQHREVSPPKPPKPRAPHRKKLLPMKG